MTLNRSHNAEVWQDEDRSTGRWVKIDCDEREALVCVGGERYAGLTVAAGRTDMDGQFGEPTIFTEWCDRETEAPILQDYRYPTRPTPDDPAPRDARPCEHYRWEPLNGGSGA